MSTTILQHLYVANGTVEVLVGPAEPELLELAAQVALKAPADIIISFGVVSTSVGLERFAWADNEPIDFSEVETVWID